MSTSTFRVRILVPSLTVFAALLTLWPAIGRTDTVPAPGTESNAGSATEAWLITHGLIGRGMVGEQSDRDVITPPPGLEVDEVRQTEDRTDEIVMQVKWWNEVVGDDTVHIEVNPLCPAINSKSPSGYFPIIGRAALCTKRRRTITVARCRACSGATMRRCFGWQVPPICHTTRRDSVARSLRYGALGTKPQCGDFTGAPVLGSRNRRFAPRQIIGGNMQGADTARPTTYVPYNEYNYLVVIAPYDSGYPCGFS
jgi:hypothetical protein